MVFGVFDRLHPGHWDFLRQAAERGDELIVVVARDSTVMELKKKMPSHSESERLAMVQNVPEVTHAVLGDEMQGNYEVIAVHRPDVICLGYDQHALTEDLREKMERGIVPQLSLIRLESYHPGMFHTSHLA